MKTYRTFAVEGYQFEANTGQQFNSTVFRVIAETEEQAINVCKMIGVKRDRYVATDSFEPEKKGNDIYKIFNITGYNEKNKNGNLIEAISVDIIDDNLKNAMTKARNIVKRKFYRLVSYSEYYYDNSS